MSGSGKSERVTSLVSIFLLLSAGIFGVGAEEWYLKVYYSESVVNGRVLDPSNPEIRVGPGERISGFLEVVIDNHRGGAWITPIIGTASWTRGKFECIALDAKTGVSTYRYQFELTAPIIPGIYYIGMFTGWMYTCDEVASNDHPSLFGDGDDVWDMPRQGWEEVMMNGRALSGPYGLPGGAIRIIVEVQIEAQRGLPKINLPLVAAYLKESLGTWGITHIDLESTFYGIEALRFSEGLNLIDVEKTARWIAAHQREDGSFGSPPDLEDTYFAIITLKTLNRLDLINKEDVIKYALKRAFEFCNMFSPSMKCPTSWSNLKESFHIVEVLSALGSLEVMSDEIKEIAINRLLSWQGNNGGWDDNIVSTYYALKILKTIGGLKHEVSGKALEFIQTLYDPDTGYYKHSPLDQYSGIDSTFYAIAALKLLGRTDMIEGKVIQNVIEYFNHDVDDVRITYIVSFILDATGKFTTSFKEHIRSSVIEKYYAFSIGAFRCQSSGWLSDGNLYHHIKSFKILVGDEASEYINKLGALREKWEEFNIFQAEIVLLRTILGNVPSDMDYRFVELVKQFSSEKGHLSDLKLTYFMLESISRVGASDEITIDEEETIEFILSHYNPDSGGFGLPSSNIYSTFLALSTLKILNALDRIERQRVVSYLSKHLSSNDIASLYYAVKSLVVLGERLNSSDVVHVIGVIRSHYMPAGYFGDVYRTAMAIELLDFLRPYGVRMKDMKLWFQVSISVPHGGIVNWQGWIEDGEIIELPPITPLIELKENERLVFKGWLLSNQDIIDQMQMHLTVLHPLNISAVYVKQYYVRVIDVKGIATGGGWYDDGSTASVRIGKTMIYDTHDKTRRDRFVGWSGDCIGVECDLENVTFRVVRPMILEAKWLRECKVILRALPQELANEIFKGLEEVWINEGAFFFYKVPVEIENPGNVVYVFKGWYDENAHMITANEEISLMVNEPMTIIAVYEPKRDIMIAGHAPSYSPVLLLATMILLPMLVAGLMWAGRVARARRMREIVDKK